MRSVTVRSAACVAAVLLLAGCNQVDRAADDTSHAANSVAAAADRMADSLDNMGSLSNRLDDATDRAGRIADRAAAIAVPAGSSLVTDDWVGKWRGVEGMTLDIAKDRARGPGHYTLTMQYSLDDKGVFDGVADGESIRFSRPDGEHELYASDGDETGLKWLAGKKDCLTVKTGEGYCRG